MNTICIPIEPEDAKRLREDCKKRIIEKNPHLWKINLPYRLILGFVIDYFLEGKK